MRQLFVIILFFSVTAFAQHSMKIGVGDGYLPKLSTANYPFSVNQSFYYAGTTEMEMYFSSGVGFSVDAEITSVKTTTIGVALKIANAKWQGARKYAYVFNVGTLNKDGSGIVVLGVGLDAKLSWLIPRVTDVFNDIDVQVRFYLPALMFQSASVSNDVCAKLCLNYRLIKF